MRFIGNKEKLVQKIYEVIKSRNIYGNSFFDCFAGISSVGKFFKAKNYQIHSSDLLYFSYVLQQAYIVNNQELNFKKIINTETIESSTLFSNPLQKVIEYLNQIETVKGFIYYNYTPSGTSNLKIPRMYYSDENGQLIDAIRIQIENWREKEIINQNEYFVLLACLIESVSFYANVSGVYSAFQKKWDPRAIKKFKIRPIQYIINNKKNYSFNVNSIDIIDEIEVDIFYLDPPYNQRQYAPNYHLLETIAKYDNPEIRGVAGLRNYQNQKSKFCNPVTALEELSKILEQGNYKTLILSYNTEGIMKQNQITSVMKQYGNLELVEFDYLRFKSNNNSSNRYIKEQLYILRK